MVEKCLGKIVSAHFGFDADYIYEFGLYLTLSLNGGASQVSAMITTNINPGCKYDTSNGRAEAILRMNEEVYAFLKAAKVRKVDDLIGKPIEVTMENRSLKDFRILTEVL